MHYFFIEAKLLYNSICLSQFFFAKLLIIKDIKRERVRKERNISRNIKRKKERNEKWRKKDRKIERERESEGEGESKKSKKGREQKVSFFANMKFVKNKNFFKIIKVFCLNSS